MWKKSSHARVDISNVIIFFCMLLITLATARFLSLLFYFFSFQWIFLAMCTTCYLLRETFLTDREGFQGIDARLRLQWRLLLIAALLNECEIDKISWMHLEACTLMDLCKNQFFVLCVSFFFLKNFVSEDSERSIKYRAIDNFCIIEILYTVNYKTQQSSMKRNFAVVWNSFVRICIPII